MDSSYAIETTNVSRAFAKSVAVENLNLCVRRGSIYGFLGRNGAGKSTAIKMIVGLLWPDSGQIQVHGVDPARFTPADRCKIGYVSERQILNPQMRVGALIQFTSSFYPDWDSKCCDRILKRFKIDPAQRIRSLSQGTARQVAFMLAMAQRPDLLILDEPAANLDVVARREFLDELLDLLREHEKTVLFSSHILSDVERVADEIGIIVRGQLKISEPLDNLKETVKQVRFFGFEKSPPALDIGASFTQRKIGEDFLVTLRIHELQELDSFCRLHRCRFEVIDLNLEDIFVEIAREQTES